MSGELREFHPEKVLATWAIRGALAQALDMTAGLVAEDNAIAETKDSPRSTRTVDRQGNVTRNRSRNKAGSLAFTYMGNAPIHEVLQALLTFDETTGAIVGDLTVQDLNGTTLVIYEGVYIEDDPTLAWGGTEGNRVWTLGYAAKRPNYGSAQAI